MAEKRPICLYNGQLQELASADSLPGGGLLSEDAFGNIIGGTSAADAMLTNGAAYDNVVIGELAMVDAITVTDSTIVGNEAVHYPAGTNTRITAFGSYTFGGHSTQGTEAIGPDSSAFGASAGKSAKGSKNSIFGSSAFGGGNTQFPGDDNSIFGYHAMDSVTDSTNGAHQNSVFGSLACDQVSGNCDTNSVFGYKAMEFGSNCNNNVIIGANAGARMFSGASNSVIIGPSAGPLTGNNPSNELWINNAQTETPLIKGYFDAHASGPLLLVNGDLQTTGGVDKLKSATTAVSVAAATAPTTGQVLTATATTTATWQDPSPSGSDSTYDTFVDVTDYTAGTTTQLTLSETPASENGIVVNFDGVTQHHTEYSISGAVITFTSAIPLGVAAVEVQIQSGIAINEPAAASVDYTKLAAALKETMFRRNAIINGNFDVWQRGTSFAAVAVIGYTADRFQYQKNGTMVHTVARSTDVPTYAQSGVKSNYSLHADVTTADTTIDAANYTFIQYTLEGYDYARIAGGDATLSFLVKATKTGTHCVTFKNEGSDRSFIREYTISVTDTWEKKTVTVPLTETGGTWNYTNGEGLEVIFTLAVGSTYQSTADAWQTGIYFGTSNQVNATDNVANNFRIAQVQLEKGSRATPFEYRSIADEIELCQRYFEKSYDLDVDPGTNTNEGATAINVDGVGTSEFIMSTKFSTRKRDNPNVTTWSSTGVIDSWQNVSTVYDGTPNRVGEGGFALVNDSGGTRNGRMEWQWQADAEL